MGNFQGQESLKNAGGRADKGFHNHTHNQRDSAAIISRVKFLKFFSKCS